MEREEKFKYLQEREPRELFDVKETAIVLPERARIFRSVACDCCGETTSENYIRLSEGKNLCLDCYSSYDRFSV